MFIPFQLHATVTAVITQSSVPLHAPHSTIADNRRTDGTIVVTWKLLTLEEAHGFITGYTVTAQQADFGLVLRQTPTSVRVSPNDTMATISGLDPKHAYTITLSANTSQGGNSSSTLLQPVGESMINLLLQCIKNIFIHRQALYSVSSEWIWYSCSYYCGCSNTDHMHITGVYYHKVKRMGYIWLIAGQ